MKKTQLSNTEFNPGDKVIVVDSNHAEVPCGAVGTIDGPADGGYGVALEVFNSAPFPGKPKSEPRVCWFAAGALKLAE